VASITFQVLDTFKKNSVFEMSKEQIESEKIPQSRYAVKKSDDPEKWNHLIFSYNTLDTYKNRAIPFAKYCKKEFGIKKLSEITPEMTKKFFKKRKEEGKSAWTLQGDRAALKKLENCMKKRDWISDESNFVPTAKKLGIPIRKKENRIRGEIYTDSEIDAIIEEVSEATKKYIKFIRGSGARMKGASTIKKKDINFAEKKIKLKEKGGYSRKISISDDFNDWLEKITKEKDLNDKILPERTDRAVQKQVEEACEKLKIKPLGLHRIRASHAYNLYKKLLKNDYSDKEARKIVSEHLGHHRESVISYYLPPNA